MEILHAPAVFDIHEEPTTLLKQHRDTSMAVGMEALHDGQERRLCLCRQHGCAAGRLDLSGKAHSRHQACRSCAGAAHGDHAVSADRMAALNNDCRPEMLVQFAIMGSAYMQNVMHVEKPRVALLNVGAEETKGRELELESYVQLAQAPVNFIGNIEARELPTGAADVVVTDGFTGNVALKLYEGMGKFMAHQMKGNLFSGFAGKLAALLILPKIRALTKKMDYKAVGGAVMLGVQKPVVKAHGSSDAQAFFNAIRQARDCVAGNVVQMITDTIGMSAEKKDGGK
ncbi:MAG: phosphate acyltransferase [Ruminococcus sp.]